MCKVFAGFDYDSPLDEVHLFLVDINYYLMNDTDRLLMTTHDEATFLKTIQKYH